MTSGIDIARSVDLVIAVTVFELAFLALHRRAAGRAIPFIDFVPNMLSGLALMFALRSAVAGAGGAALALWLSMAGAAHAVDILIRWRRASRTEPPRHFLARKSAT